MSYFQDEDDRMYELFAEYDYKREAFGDPCLGCGRLRGGGDCGYCMSEDEDPAPSVAPAADLPPSPKRDAALDRWAKADDDIPF